MWGEDMAVPQKNYAPLDDDVSVGGAVIPILILSWKEDEVVKIYKPKINSIDARRLCEVINDIYKLSSVFRPPVINLTLYPPSQFIEKPGELSKLFVKSTVVAYTDYFVKHGFSLNEIDSILSNRNRFVAIMENIPFLIIGNDYEELKSNVEAMSEDHRIPLPDLSATGLAKRIREKKKSRNFMGIMGIKKIDVALMIVSGAILLKNVPSWLDYVKRIDPDKTYSIKDILERTYGVKNTYLMPTLATIVPTSDNDNVRKLLEYFIDSAIDTVEETWGIWGMLGKIGRWFIRI
jgi:hypothetical protein